eukprot:scaffold255243_cov48-Attheya_sp.AAC.2
MGSGLVPLHHIRVGKALLYKRATKRCSRSRTRALTLLTNSSDRSSMMLMSGGFHQGFFQVPNGVLKATKPFLLPNDRLIFMPSKNDEQEKDSREQA